MLRAEQHKKFCSKDIKYLTMGCPLVWWTASGSKARDGVCRCAGGTSSWGLSLEDWGAVKSLLAVGQHVHPTLAAGEMLGGRGSCRTDSLRTGIGKVSPAHRAKVPLWAGLSDCPESHAPTGAGVLQHCLHKYWHLPMLSSGSCLPNMYISTSSTPGLVMPGLPSENNLTSCLQML